MAEPEPEENPEPEPAPVLPEAEPVTTASQPEPADASMAEEPATVWAPAAPPPRGNARDANRQVKPAFSSQNRDLLVSVLVLVLIIAAILLAHRAIGHVWPPSLRLFHVLGFK